MPDRRDFTVEDFLMDDQFIEWMLHPSPQKHAYWEDYKRRNPSQVDTLEQAIHVFNALELNNHFLSESEAFFLKKGIMDQTRKSRATRRLLAPWGRVAAAISMILVAWIFIDKFITSAPILVETAYGVHRQITLPDSSKVTLNGNSSLRYSSDFEEREMREVWLGGEAFFEVTRSAKKRFIVHTGELDVEVLGTSFNVDMRESITRVELNTGSITVHLRGGAAVGKLLLKPGEMIEYKKSDASIIKMAVDPARFASWRDDAFDFEGTAVVEIAEILEERFGYDITIATPELGAKLFTGRFSSNDTNILMAAMEKALRMEVKYEGQKKMVWRLK